MNPECLPYSAKPLLLIVSGPAGSGKTTLINGMIATFGGRLLRIITATTRPPRRGEQNGIDYHFLDQATFVHRVETEAFYEWAEVHGHTYGTLKKAVDEPLNQGVDLLANVDVQGAAAWRRVAAAGAFPGRVVSIFIMPANIEVLRRRMCGRGLDEQATIEQRLHNAEREIAAVRQFDYCILSGSRQEDLDAAASIFKAERLRILSA